MDRYVRSHRRRTHPATTLDDDEQGELALKVRYGIGLDLLLGERAVVTASASSSRRGPPPPRLVREPDEGTRVRAAALGLGAGRRGQWLGR